MPDPPPRPSGAAFFNLAGPVMRYQVRHHSEEFCCPWCGAPVMVGDRAYQCGPDGDCYCSERCASADRFDAGYGNGGTVGTSAPAGGRE